MQRTPGVRLSCSDPSETLPSDAGVCRHTVPLGHTPPLRQVNQKLLFLLTSAICYNPQYTGMSKIRGDYSNQNLRTAVGVAVGLAVLSVLTDSAIDVVPIAVLSVGMLAYSVADDRYSLPDGTDSAVYGAVVSLAGVAFFLAYSAVVIGGALAAAGLWFVLDGTTAVVYGEEGTEHEYVSEIDEDSDEVMSRMMTLREVYTALQDSPASPDRLGQ